MAINESFYIIELKQNIKRYDNNNFKDLIDAEKLKTIHRKNREDKPKKDSD